SLARLDAISEYAIERARPLPLPISGGTAEGLAGDGGVSRRKFLIGVGAGGVVLAGTAVGGALIGSAVTSPATLDFLKMKALVALYEELEKAGLDTLVSGGIAAVGAALELAKTISGIVSAGAKVVDGAVLNFERLFPTARQGIAFVEGLINALAKQVRDLQQLLTDVTGIARPVTDAVGKFFSDLLDKIPFGVGANVKALVNSLTALVGAIPTFIESVNTQLLTPLRTDWFTDDDSKGVKGNLLEPMRKQLMQPANQLVAQTTKVSDEWQKMVTPINRVIAQRDAVRKQIVDAQAGKQTP
ncbi:MAG: hypothetical protein ABI874_08470, partial [Chloroflexota bacterium]